MVTAETAVAMPALVLALAAALSLLGAGVAQLQVTDTARVVARAVAAGENIPGSLAGRHGIRVSVDRGDLTCVRVERDLPGPLRLTHLSASSRACVWTEPQ